jgi:hypothetical protein
MSVIDLTELAEKHVMRRGPVMQRVEVTQPSEQAVVMACAEQNS